MSVAGPPSSIVARERLPPSASSIAYSSCSSACSSASSESGALRERSSARAQRPSRARRPAHDRLRGRRRRPLTAAATARRTWPASFGSAPGRAPFRIRATSNGTGPASSRRLAVDLPSSETVYAPGAAQDAAGPLVLLVAGRAARVADRRVERQAQVPRDAVKALARRPVDAAHDVAGRVAARPARPPASAPAARPRPRPSPGNGVSLPASTSGFSCLLPLLLAASSGSPRRGGT